jgi:PhnB protein
MGLVVYLMFNGQAEEAMHFYAHATGGTIEFIQKYGDDTTPDNGNHGNLVMHGIMNIMGATVMFSDSTGERKITFGDHISLSLDFDNEAEQEKTFVALAKGGNITMPLQDTSWNARFGICTDAFGVQWMVNHDKPKIEELG